MSSTELDQAIFDALDEICETTADIWAEVSPIVRSGGFEVDRTLFQGFLRDKLIRNNPDLIPAMKKLSGVKSADRYFEEVKETFVPILIEYKEHLTT